MTAEVSVMALTYVENWDIITLVNYKLKKWNDVMYWKTVLVVLPDNIEECNLLGNNNIANI